MIRPTVKRADLHEGYFTAKVNSKEYHGTFEYMGDIICVISAKEVNSQKQTTWRIIHAIEMFLNR